MQTLIFTGNGSAGIALAATATARATSLLGRKTLLASIGPSHSLSALLGVSIKDSPETIAQNLDAWELDPFHHMSEYLERIRPQLFGVLTQISGDELPALPGLDLFLGLEYIQKHIADAYDMVVIDAGQHDALLRALSVPDGFRWFLRIAFGLDREPGRNTDSINNALLPVGLIPFDGFGKIQGARVRLEQLRDKTIDIATTTARYVLRPDGVGFNEARLAIPALQLHGLAIDSLIVGPLLPEQNSDRTLQEIAASQHAIAAEAESLWEPRPMLPMPITLSSNNIASFDTPSKTMYHHTLPTDTHNIQPPIEYGDQQDPFVLLRMPGLPKDALQLTINSDELVIRAGPYRRHLLLPKCMRQVRNVKASRKGEQLTIRPRTE